MERCLVHPESGGSVCGEFVCGTCYGERLLTDPMPKMRRLPEIDMTNGLHGHDLHFRYKEVPQSGKLL